MHGIDGLLDSRGYKREGSSVIAELRLEELLDRIISAQRGRINVKSVHELLHLYLHMQGKHNIIEFKSRISEYISYAVLDRYIKGWKKKNPIKVALIYKGEDKLVGNIKASMGRSNYKVTSINQVVEIDASPLDKVFDASELARGFGVDIDHIQSWQKRYVLSH